jgi:hypothetical protein
MDDSDDALTAANHSFAGGHGNGAYLSWHGVELAR